MGRRKDKEDMTATVSAAGVVKSHTLPSSPTHSSSSSDFEFMTISLSPRKSSISSAAAAAAHTTTTTCSPADELFYKGQLLPLHLSPRISMVRTLLLASSSSSSTTAGAASRDSTGSSSNDSQYSSFSSDIVLLGADSSTSSSCNSSSRPSSVTDECEEFKRLNPAGAGSSTTHPTNKKTKYFSRFQKFSSVFRKESNKAAAATRHLHQDPYNKKGFGSSHPPAPSSVKRMSASAKEVIRKYLKKVKPLYEKLSQRQQQKMANDVVPLCMKSDKRDTIIINNNIATAAYGGGNNIIAHSFSGNLRYPTTTATRRRRRSYAASSCPSSMRSSPSHSGILSRTTGYTPTPTPAAMSSTSTMEELQNAIQGAIAHCKNSMLQNNNKSMVAVVSNEI